MGYPTPQQWRSYADSARSLADQYRADGDEATALRKEDDADFYDAAAWREEWRLAHLNTMEKAA